MRSLAGSLRLSVFVLGVAGCGGEGRTPVHAAGAPSASPPLPSSPEEARVEAFVAELDAMHLGDCHVAYESAHDGEGNGLIVFHGVERHAPPSASRPPAQITFHSSLRTERYRPPADVEQAARARREEFESCMREHEGDHRVRKGLSVPGETCRFSLLPSVPTAHYREDFAITRAESSGSHFLVPEGCKEAFSMLEGRLTPYPSSH